MTLRGVHLTAVSEGVMCRFAGGVPAAAAKVSESAVECVSPQNGQEQMVNVDLVWDAVSMQASNALQYLYHGRVSVEKLVPTRGPMGGDALVTVLGAGFKQEGLLLRLGSSLVRRSDMMWGSSTLAVSYTHLTLTTILLV